MTSLKDIRSDLETHLGKRIKLKANRGRKKTVTRVGVLEKTYPHVFTVRLDKNLSSIPRVSYSYTDILTASIELEYLEDKIITGALGSSNYFASNKRGNSA